MLSPKTSKDEGLPETQLGYIYAVSSELIQVNFLFTKQQTSLLDAAATILVAHSLHYYLVCSISHWYIGPVLENQ